MNTKAVAGVVLIALGVLALIYGGFSYPSDTHEADLGPVEFSVTEKERVNVPQWVGIGSVVIGVGLVLWSRKKL